MEEEIKYTLKELQDKLTEKEKLFVVFYLLDFNATKAAIEAGYSRKSAKEIGYENLTKPHIKTEIRKVLDSIRDKAILSIKDMQRELSKIIKFDITRIITFNKSGSLFACNSEDIPDIERAGLRSVEVKEVHGKSEEGNLILDTKVTAHDKLGAIKLLGKSKAMFVDTVKKELSGSININVVNYGDKKK